VLLATQRLNLVSKIKHIKPLLKLALPAMIAQLMMCLNGFIDTVMSGHHSPTTLSQVAMGSSIWVPVIIFVSGILSSVGALTSHAYGADDTSKVRRYLSSAIVLAIILSVFCTFMLFGAVDLLPYVNVPNYLIQGIDDYISMLAIGFWGQILFWALRGWVEGLQKTHLAMIATFTSTMINIPLNYMFIYGWWIIPEMGAKGCGIATAISFMVMPLAMLILIFKDRALYHMIGNFAAIKANYDFASLKKICSLGLPVGISGFVEGSLFCVLAIMLAPLGENSVAAHQIALNISSMLFMVPLGLNFAVSVAVGRACGQQKNAYEVGVIVQSGLILAFCIALIFCTFLFLGRHYIPYIYTTDPEVYLLAVELLMFAAIFQLPDGLQVVLYGVLKGLQDTFVPMLLGITSYWLLGATFAYLFVFNEYFGALGVKGAWVGLNIGLLAAFLAFCVRLKYTFNQLFLTNIYKLNVPNEPK